MGNCCDPPKARPDDGGGAGDEANGAAGAARGAAAVATEGGGAASSGPGGGDSAAHDALSAESSGAGHGTTLTGKLRRGSWRIGHQSAIGPFVAETDTGDVEDHIQVLDDDNLIVTPESSPLLLERCLVLLEGGPPDAGGSADGNTSADAAMVAAADFSVAVAPAPVSDATGSFDADAATNAHLRVGAEMSDEWSSSRDGPGALRLTNASTRRAVFQVRFIDGQTHANTPAGANAGTDGALGGSVAAAHSASTVHLTKEVLATPETGILGPGEDIAVEVLLGVSGVPDGAHAELSVRHDRLLITALWFDDECDLEPWTPREIDEAIARLWKLKLGESRRYRVRMALAEAVPLGLNSIASASARSTASSSGLSDSELCLQAAPSGADLHSNAGGKNSDSDSSKEPIKCVHDAGPSTVGAANDVHRNSGVGGGGSGGGGSGGGGSSGSLSSFDGEDSPSLSASASAQSTSSGLPALATATVAARLAAPLSDETSSVISSGTALSVSTSTSIVGHGTKQFARGVGARAAPRSAGLHSVSRLRLRRKTAKFAASSVSDILGRSASMSAASGKINSAPSRIFSRPSFLGQLSKQGQRVLGRRSTVQGSTVSMSMSFLGMDPASHDDVDNPRSSFGGSAASLLESRQSFVSTISSASPPPAFDAELMMGSAAERAASRLLGECVSLQRPLMAGAGGGRWGWSWVIPVHPAQRANHFLSPREQQVVRALWVLERCHTLAYGPEGAESVRRLGALASIAEVGSSSSLSAKHRGASTARSTRSFLPQHLRDSVVWVDDAFPAYSDARDRRQGDTTVAVQAASAGSTERMAVSWGRCKTLVTLDAANSLSSTGRRHRKAARRRRLQKISSNPSTTSHRQQRRSTSSAIATLSRASYLRPPVYLIGPADHDFRDPTLPVAMRAQAGSVAPGPLAHRCLGAFACVAMLGQRRDLLPNMFLDPRDAVEGSSPPPSASLDHEEPALVPYPVSGALVMRVYTGAARHAHLVSLDDIVPRGRPTRECGNPGDKSDTKTRHTDEEDGSEDEGEGEDEADESGSVHLFCEGRHKNECWAPLVFKGLLKCCQQGPKIDGSVGGSSAAGTIGNKGRRLSTQTERARSEDSETDYTGSSAGSSVASYSSSDEEDKESEATTSQHRTLESQMNVLASLSAADTFRLLTGCPVTEIRIAPQLARLHRKDAKKNTNLCHRFLDTVWNRVLSAVADADVVGLTVVNDENGNENGSGGHARRLGLVPGFTYGLLDAREIACAAPAPASSGQSRGQRTKGKRMVLLHNPWRPADQQDFPSSVFSPSPSKSPSRRTHRMAHGSRGRGSEGDAGASPLVPWPHWRGPWSLIDAGSATSTWEVFPEAQAALLPVSGRCRRDSFWVEWDDFAYGLAASLSAGTGGKTREDARSRTQRQRHQQASQPRQQHGKSQSHVSMLLGSLLIAHVSVRQGTEAAFWQNGAERRHTERLTNLDRSRKLSAQPPQRSRHTLSSGAPRLDADKDLLPRVPIWESVKCCGAWKKSFSPAAASAPTPSGAMYSKSRARDGHVAVGAAGGSCDFGSWRDNPQFRCEAPERATTALVTLRLTSSSSLKNRRMSLRSAGHRHNSGNFPTGIGLYVFPAPSDGRRIVRPSFFPVEEEEDGFRGERDTDAVGAGVVVGRPLGFSPAVEADEVSIEIRLGPATGPIVLIPCTDTPGISASFELVVSYEKRIETGVLLFPLFGHSGPAGERWWRYDHRGSWHPGRTAGGCRLNTSFGTNAAFLATPKLKDGAVIHETDGDNADEDMVMYAVVSFFRHATGRRMTRSDAGLDDGGSDNDHDTSTAVVVRPLIAGCHCFGLPEDVDGKDRSPNTTAHSSRACSPLEIPPTAAEVAQGDASIEVFRVFGEGRMALSQSSDTYVSVCVLMYTTVVAPALPSTVLMRARVSCTLPGLACRMKTIFATTTSDRGLRSLIQV